MPTQELCHKYPEKSLYEHDIILKLLSYAQKKLIHEGDFLATEAQYSKKQRRADFLIVSNCYTHAFEIKSDRDNLDKLSEQLSDYKRTFDYVTIATTKKHLKNVRQIISKKIGLILVDEDNLFLLRNAHPNRRLSKRNLIAMCSKPALAKVLNISIQKTNLPEIQQKAYHELTINELQKLMKTELKRRFWQSYLNFMDEAFPPYTEEDLLFFRQLPQNLSLDCYTKAF